MGMAWIAIGEGVLPASVIKKLNEEFAKLEVPVTVKCTQKDSHMFDGTITVEWLEECATEAFRMKRASLNLDATARGMLVCDRCPSTFDQNFRTLRKNWAQRLNVEIMGGEIDVDPTDVRAPAKFSAEGTTNIE